MNGGNRGNYPMNQNQNNANQMQMESQRSSQNMPRTSAPKTFSKRGRGQNTFNQQQGAWKPSEDQIERDGRSICVRNLDKNIDEASLDKLFKTAGNVQSTTLPRDKAGNSKGYAYIEFNSVDSRDNAINCFNGLDLIGNGKQIIVEPKRVNRAGLSARAKGENQTYMVAKALTQLMRIGKPRGRGHFRGSRGGMRGGFQGQNPNQGNMQGQPQQGQMMNMNMNQQMPNGNMNMNQQIPNGNMNMNPQMNNGNNMPYGGQGNNGY